MIYFTSDLHFNHDKEFVYKDRGFNSVQEMNQTIINNFNNVLTETDYLYILGDLMLGDYDEGIKLINQLKCNLHIIIGNHDTETRVELYRTIPNIKEIEYATIIKYNKQQFYLSHYPAHTGDKNKHLSTQIVNLYGHTHQKDLFYNDDPFMYNVGVDSHNNMPVSVEQVLEDIKLKKSGYKGV